MGARIELRLGELAVPASLNDTAAARALAQRLPLDLRMCASTVGCCGALPFSLPADPALVHRGWTDGDVNYNPSGDWLAIFFDDERNSLRYGDQLTIGRVEGHLDALRALVQSKLALELAASKNGDALSAAIARSARLMAEDLCREAGYMLPQSGNTRAMLESLKSEPAPAGEAAASLLGSLRFNEGESAKPERWRCTVCGYIHEGPMTDDFTCPRCRQPASVFEKLD